MDMHVWTCMCGHACVDMHVWTCTCVGMRMLGLAHAWRTIREHAHTWI